MSGDRVLALLASLLKLPPPEPPSADGAGRLFRPAAGYLKLRRMRWLLLQLGTLAGLVFAFTWYEFPFFKLAASHVRFGPVRLDEVPGLPIVLWIEIAGAAFYVAQLIPSYLLVRLDYESRWYWVSDRALRLREGIREVRERTMTFANVQQVSIRQGPLARLFGVADLVVRSAGGGESRGAEHVDAEEQAKSLHVGYFRGVDNAAEIRDLVLAHLKQLRGSGLGDPDDADAGGGQSDRRVVARLERLEAELVRVRAAIASR